MQVVLAGVLLLSDDVHLHLTESGHILVQWMRVVNHFVRWHTQFQALSWLKVSLAARHFLEVMALSIQSMWL